MAVKNKNRCLKCFDCPRCTSTLVFGEKSHTKEFYLQCQLCRWTSFSASQPPSSGADDGAPPCLAYAESPEAYSTKHLEYENAGNRGQLIVTNITEELGEAQESQQLQRGKRAAGYASRSALLKPQGKRERSAKDPSATLSSRIALLEQRRTEVAEKLTFQGRSLATASPEEIPPGLHAKMTLQKDEELTPTTIVFHERTPAIFQEKHCDFPLQRKSLLSRRSKRCGKCDKLVVKPSLSSVEFKRLHTACLFLPLFSVKKWEKQGTTEDGTRRVRMGFHVRVRNPTDSVMRVRIRFEGDDVTNVQMGSFPAGDVVLGAKEGSGTEKVSEVEARREESPELEKFVLERGNDDAVVLFTASVQGTTAVNINFRLLCTVDLNDQPFTFPVRFAMQPAPDPYALMAARESSASAKSVAASARTTSGST
eukprot:CAMPEP_0119125528 /NCGR_PEP_ID=MMETSP1310-20130426/4766_1 /TAXON_ID=464262 /ORGANISM="Genus nov. species nov., Strain RCC2339" /LENGTH=423 /DNA_ID=CAMNT_0007115603 /DNA_START=222 /DNA_END=1490 /DNA_ORIENTATION=-